MKSRIVLVATLSVLMLAVLFTSICFAEDTGKLKVGVLIEHEKMRNQDSKVNWEANSPGLILGYEKENEDFWWAVEGSYSYGRYTPNDGTFSKIDRGRLLSHAVVGQSYDFDSVVLKPFVGLGLNWEADDLKGDSDSYVTEYVLPVGVRAEKKYEAGLFGADLEFDTVLRRELYTTGSGGSWGSRNLDGSYSVEAGLFYEPASLPIGFRPYYRFTKYQKTKYWDYISRSTVGVEAYYTF